MSLIWNIITNRKLKLITTNNWLESRCSFMVRLPRYLRWVLHTAQWVKKEGQGGVSQIVHPIQKCYKTDPPKSRHCDSKTIFKILITQKPNSKRPPKIPKNPKNAQKSKKKGKLKKTDPPKNRHCDYKTIFKILITQTKPKKSPKIQKNPKNALKSKKKGKFKKTDPPKLNIVILKKNSKF